MEFFDAIKTRRSVRVFTETPVPDEVMARALDAALIAPNSSNMQTWQFLQVSSPETKAKLVKACFSQNAAKTAQELVVVVANISLWKRNRSEMLRVLTESKAPKFAFDYYGKLVPLTYGFTWLAPLKWLLLSLIGLVRPITRRPSKRDMQEVAITSAALAAQNFMLALTAQGFASCPMGGFDEVRVKKMLRLTRNSRVVMVIGIGEADPLKGLYGPQVRFNRDWFVARV